MIATLVSKRKISEAGPFSVGRRIHCIRGILSGVEQNNKAGMQNKFAQMITSKTLEVMQNDISNITAGSRTRGLIRSGYGFVAHTMPDLSVKDASYR